MRKIALLILIALFITSCRGFTPSPTATTVEKPTATEENTLTPQMVMGQPDQGGSFSLASLNSTPPDDIIQEIAYYGGQGGTGHPCDSETKLVTHMDYTHVEIMQGNAFFACNVPMGKAHVKVTDSLGKVEEFTGDVDDRRGENIFDWSYAVDITQPIGQYTFYFYGEGWDFTQKVDVVNATVPRFYIDEETNRIILWGFQSNELVRLLFYAEGPLSKHIGDSENQILRGWKEYQVDSAGNLSINADIKSFEVPGTQFYAVGNISGQIKSLEKGWNDAWDFPGVSDAADIFCGSQPLNLHANDFIKLITTKFPSSNGIIFFNNTRPNILSKIPTNTLLQIREGPFCYNKTFWWEAECVTGKTCRGLIAEKTDNKPNLQILSPTDTTQIPACPGTLQTRLKVGVNAQVTTSGKAPQLSLREKPSMSTKQAHVIAAGRKMMILDGPLCIEKSYWWYIRSEQGFEGWTREGDNVDYWIDPLP